MLRSEVTLRITNWIRDRRGVAVSESRCVARRWRIVTLALAAWSLPSLAFAQKVPVGWEFQVNSYTAGGQGGYYDRVGVASDSAGNFVVVWDEAPPRDGPYARKYSSTGVPVGPEFLIDQGAYQPAVAADAAGNFVVAYSSYGYCQGSYGGMCARRFDSAGAPRGPSFLVETGLVYHSWNPKVASDAAGNFVVVWPGESVETYEYGHVWARRYDSTGAPLDATEFQVTTSYSPSCCWGGDNEDNDGLEVAADAAGNFMVVWNQEYYYLFGRVFDSAGVAAGPAFMIDASLDRETPQAGVAADGAGHFIVVWEGMHNEGIRGQRFDTAGALVGAEFQVSSETTYTLLHVPRVSASTAGDFVVVWAEAYDRDGYYMGVFGRQFDSTGTPVGADFQANTYTYDYQGYADVASAGNGDFVVVWVSDYQDGYGTGIFGQRFGDEGPLGCRPAPINLHRRVATLLFRRVHPARLVRCGNDHVHDPSHRYLPPPDNGGGQLRRRHDSTRRLRHCTTP